jgi:hypothetical protein
MHGRTLPFENSVPDVELGYGYFNGRVQGNALIENNLCAQRSISDEKMLVTIEDGF